VAHRGGQSRDQQVLSPEALNDLSDPSRLFGHPECARTSQIESVTDIHRASQFLVNTNTSYYHLHGVVTAHYADLIHDHANRYKL